MKFETPQLEGVTINRTIVTTNKAETTVEAPTITMKEKVRASKVTPGLSPHDGSVIRGSSFALELPYGKYYYIEDKFGPDGANYQYHIDFKWNPMILEPGDYKVSYYILNAAHFPNSFHLDVHHNSVTDSVYVPKEKLVTGTWYDLGTYPFAAGTVDEYVSFKDLPRMTAFKYEKVTPDHAVIKQVLASTHKFFDEYQVDDVNNEETEQIINAMAVKGITDGLITNHQFDPDRKITRAEMIALLTRMMNLPEDPEAADYGDTQGRQLPTKEILERPRRPDFCTEYRPTAGHWE
ncbi:hypothetical protein N6H14_26550 [Paenibacillus sp. CC-CFT747]|nr:hypothetical protein N6H14_26550 [Paenibacillus sp. CC-CFT747]